MKDVFTRGEGPFVTPLLVQTETISSAPGVDQCVLHFRLEDGALLQAPITTQAAVALSQFLAAFVAARQKPPAEGSRH